MVRVLVSTAPNLSIVWRIVCLCLLLCALVLCTKADKPLVLVDAVPSVKGWKDTCDIKVPEFDHFQTQIKEGQESFIPSMV